MEERRNMTSELQSVAFDSYPMIFAKMRELSDQYGGLPAESLISAFGAATGGLYPFGFGHMYTPNPNVQNKRVKGIPTRPANYGRDDVANFVQKPESHERELRAVEKGLEYTAYPMYHMRTLYQNLLTYHSYIAPHLTDEEDSKKDDFWREWKLLEKLRVKLNPKATAHEFSGRALQEGKIFIVPRVSVDKPHNSVNYAFCQQLPSDWCKIVGFNNVSKYTVAFNLMYFCEMGTDWRQFGDLFEPYMTGFWNALTPAPVRQDKKIVYASRTRINLQEAQVADAYYQNGRWFYWVTLPVDRVFPFEIDDTDVNVLPPFTGLFLDFIQLSQMEQIQLELLQNPLVSLLHGEIPYWDNRTTDAADQYKLSNTGLKLFTHMWYEMLAANNTGGIGLFAAPLENMKLESLSEAPNAMDIVAKGVQDVSAKSGLAAISPSTPDTRAGTVQVSLKIESQYPKTIYTCYERMMAAIIDRLNLRYDWDFKMLGDLSGDEDRMKELREEMTLGILPAVIEYNALRDRSILDDIAISDAVIASRIMDKRRQLASSYTSSNTGNGGDNNATVSSDGGRPRIDDVSSSEGHEDSVDAPAER